MMGNKVKLAFIVCSVLGVLLVALGVCITIIVDQHVQGKVSDYVSLRDESAPLYGVWQGDSTKVSRFVSYYFYNVSNAEHVRLGAVPVLELKGPFTFTEQLEKVNISWNCDRSQVTYTVNRTFTFYDVPCSHPASANTTYDWSNPPRCSLPRDTPIATANVPLLSIVQQCMALGWVEDGLMSKFIDHVNEVVGSEDLFPVLPASKLILGYNDTVFDKINDVIRFFDSVFNKTVTLRNTFFSLQRLPSQELSSPSTIFTGVDDLSTLNTYTQWVGNTVLPDMWNGSCAGVSDDVTAAYIQQANAINGSDGSLFPPLTDGPRAMFMEELTRSVQLTKAGSSSFLDVPLSQFVFDPTVLDNSSQYQPNCAFDGDGPSGVLNMTRLGEVPVFMSNPVYYNADSSYLKNVSGLAGLTPSFSSFDIDYWTGLCFRSRRRFQINIRILPIRKLELVRYVREGGFYLPAITIDANMEVAQSVADSWQSEFGDALSAASNTRLAGFIAGSFLLAVALSLLIVLVARCHRTVPAEQAPLLSAVHVSS